MKHYIIWAMAIILLGWWLVKPVFLHFESTARDVEIELIANPFIESDRLVYKWSGDVYRSCPVEIRRSIIDSQGIDTTLVALSFGRLPLSDLGVQSYEVSIRVPTQISEGPAIYQAVEISRCDWLQGLFPHPVPYPPVHFTVTR